MTAPDPVAIAAALRAQGWRRAEVAVTARGAVRIVVEDDDEQPRRIVTSGRKTPTR